MTGCLDEAAKFPIGDRDRVNPEGVDGDAMDRRFFGIMSIRNPSENVPPGVWIMLAYASSFEFVRCRCRKMACAMGVRSRRGRPAVSPWVSTEADQGRSLIEGRQTRILPMPLGGPFQQYLRRQRRGSGFNVTLGKRAVATSVPLRFPAAGVRRHGRWHRHDWRAIVSRFIAPASRAGGLDLHGHDARGVPRCRGFVFLPCGERAGRYDRQGTGGRKGALVRFRSGGCGRQLPAEGAVEVARLFSRETQEPSTTSSRRPPFRKVPGWS